MELMDLYMEKFAASAPKPMPTEANIRQGIQPKLVVAVDKTNNTKLFLQNLDKVLQRLSGFERVKITALDSMKHAQVIKSFGLPIPGMILIRGKESSKSNALTENEISKFFTKNLKLWR